jgi:hypothetical protein
LPKERPIPAESHVRRKERGRTMSGCLSKCPKLFSFFSPRATTLAKRVRD